ncbi:hypothetical protein K493DRAFT_323487 [Basidiobolus meristosporus CBS 931.73]|uniref:Myb-like domain-containing protein n=1 Tax=Basidiobolus meristosporus CBS 931.73 TaxID=1314790 RepID=A0A1Y1YTM6_9FUNG|nr:hypothetical protein K493DRAFT_323487 [Basidiobolus meristosporus CBS 931.73]|eukprot:ORY01319.1 hypothetical protein K493DRAFT_323487 [Basidiobolus meristosporus CBS 931.73]
MEVDQNDSSVAKETAEQPETPEISKELLERQEWIKNMRLQFCVRPEFEVTKNIIHEDGMLNQEYFLPPKGAKLEAEPERKWTETERNLLIQGIQQYGIGHFREISEALLPQWSGNDLRVKSMRLMGRQNLQLYKDWKGSIEDIEREYERNKAIGLKYNTWKNSTLVYDDAGLVLKAIEASEPKP